MRFSLLVQPQDVLRPARRRCNENRILRALGDLPGEGLVCCRTSGFPTLFSCFTSGEAGQGRSERLVSTGRMDERRLVNRSKTWQAGSGWRPGTRAVEFRTGWEPAAPVMIVP
jgi:hypothetical protein